MFWLVCADQNNYNLIENSIIMALSPAERNGFSVCLVLTILLTGLQFSVAATGHKFFEVDDLRYVRMAGGVNYSLKDYDPFAAFMIVTAGLTFIISIALLITFCGDRFKPKQWHLLVTLNLLLEFAIAVTLGITTSLTSNLRDYLYNQPDRPENSDLNLYYRLLIADTVLTFVLQLTYLLVIYFATLRQTQNHRIATPILMDPPITTDQMQ